MVAMRLNLEKANQVERKVKEIGLLLLCFRQTNGGSRRRDFTKTESLRIMAT